MKKIKKTFYYICRQINNTITVLDGYDNPFDAEETMNAMDITKKQRRHYIVLSGAFLHRNRGGFKIITHKTRNIETPKDCIYCGAPLGYLGVCGQCMDERY